MLQQAQILKSNPLVQICTSGEVPLASTVHTAQRVLQFLKKVKVILIHLSLWKCSYLDETRFNSLLLCITRVIAFLCITSRLHYLTHYL